MFYSNSYSILVLVLCVFNSAVSRDSFYNTLFINDNQKLRLTILIRIKIIEKCL